MVQSKNNKKILIALIIGIVATLAAIVLAGILSCKAAGGCTFSTGCTVINGVDGCTEIGKLPNSKLPLIGVSVAWVGLFYYIFVAGLFLQLLLNKPKDKQTELVSVLVSAAVFGVIFDAFLAWQNFVTLSPCRDGVWFCPLCKLCAWTYLTQLFIFGSAAYLYIQNARQDSKTGDVKSFGKGVLYSLVSLAAALIISFIFSLSVGKKDAVDCDKNPDHPDCKAEAPQVPLPDTAKIPKILEQFYGATTAVKMETNDLSSVEGAKVPVLEIHKFADFLCPHCMHASVYLEFLLKRWPNRLKVYYRYLPLDGSCNYLTQGSNPAVASQRCDSAKAAVCAGEQGPQYFAHFYHGVFDFQNRQIPPEMDALESLAKKYGGDWNKQQACMTSRGQMGIDRDLKVIDGWMKSKKLEQPSTPILVVGDHLLPAGVPDFRSLILWVDAMIIKKDGSKAIDDFNKLHPWAQAAGKAK